MTNSINPSINICRIKLKNKPFLENSYKFLDLNFPFKMHEIAPIAPVNKILRKYIITINPKVDKLRNEL
jgi:hypothetical protein